MAPINLPDGSQVSEIVLPDGSTASEVLAPDGSTVFSATTIPDASALQNPDIYYPVNEGSGADLNDEQNNIDATINGATWQSGAGVGDAYLSLDGSNDDFVTNSAPTAGGQSARSFAAWVRVDTSSSPRAAISHGTQNNNDMFSFRFRDAGSIQLTDNVNVVDGITYSANTWTLLVATYAGGSSGTATAYLAEVGDASPSSVSGSLGFNAYSDPMRWGSEEGVDFFWPGDIDLGLFYNQELTSSDVQSLFDNTKDLYQ